MDSTTVVAYADGWITVTAPDAPASPTGPVEPTADPSVTAALDRSRTSPLQLEYELEPGQLQVGPSGEPPDHLTALDGETELPMTPQLREFYGYARWWRGSVLLSEIPDPGEYLDLLTDSQVDLAGMLAAEYELPGVLADARGRGLNPTRCALLMVDTVTAYPYHRAYLVYDPPEHSRVGTLTGGHNPAVDFAEPEVWAFVGEHHHYADLRAWLAWCTSDRESDDEPGGGER